MTTLAATSPPRGGRRTRRLLFLSGVAIAIAIAFGVASAWGSHGRGTTISVSVSPTGTATVVLDQRQAGSCTVGQPYFGAIGNIDLYSLSGPGGTRAFVQSYSDTPTCTRTAGTFIEVRTTFAIDLSGASDGWYVFRHQGNAKVANIVNVNGGGGASATNWSSETQFRLVAGQQTGSPTYGVALPFAAAIGFEYSQNLVASDPDGGAVSANSMCCNAGTPDFAVTTDVITTTAGAVANQQIVIPAVTTGGLTGSQYLEFKVRVTDDDGEYSELDMVLSPTTNVPPTLTPPAQTSISVSPGSTTQVPLSATDPNGAQSVSFSVSGQPAWVSLSQTAGNPATGTITVNPPPGVAGTFTFNVNASDNDAGLPSTSSFTMTVTVLSVPDAVQGLTATAGSEQVELDWSAPLADGGSPVTGYRVGYRPAGSSDPFTTVDVAAGPTTVTGLTDDVEYEFVVSALNANGEGVPTTVTATPVTLVDAPGPVQDLDAIVSSNHVSLSWSAPENDGGSPVTGYRVEYRLPGADTWTTGATTDADTTAAVIGPLSRGVDYEVRVIPINDVGDGAATTTVVTTLPHRPHPGSVSDRTVLDGLPTTAPTYTEAGNRVVSIAPTATGAGSWSTTADGAVYTAGDAAFHGSLTGSPLGAPIVGITPTSSGGGYYLVGADGGVFAFGDATYYGSMGGTPLNQPVSAIVPTCSGQGYYLVAEDGGVFAFGDAVFHGSMGGSPLNRGMTGIVPTCSGGGYWTYAADGGVFTFGDATFYGSLGSSPPVGGVATMVPASDDRGYWLVGVQPGTYPFGSAVG